MGIRRMERIPNTRFNVVLGERIDKMSFCGILKEWIIVGLLKVSAKDGGLKMNHGLSEEPRMMRSLGFH